MASLYKNNGTWYIAVRCNKKRKFQSLKTKDYKVAKQLKPYAESAIIAEFNGYVVHNEKLTFAELVPRFLSQRNNWSDTTIRMYRCILYAHADGKALPSNLTSRAIYTRVINQCWRWGLKNHLVEKAHYLPGDVRGEARHHTFTADELKLIKQGMSIYNVSKLLGHASVRTTEQHYAPLLTAEIEDFEL